MIAIIAGKGSLPQQACKALLKANKKFFVVLLFPQNNLNLIKNTVQNKSEIFEQNFYKAGQILKLLKNKKTKKILFIGKVDKNNLFKKIKLDWFSVKLLATTACKSDKSIMEALVNKLEKEGIQVISQDEILGPLLVRPGILCGKITPELKQDIEFGLKTAHDISFCNIGQTVVVKDKMVLAVEAIEGTDKCIARGIELGKKDVVVCKTAHKNHNKKYDLPTLGPDSLKNLKPGNIKAIAWQSDKTFIANQDKFVRRAKNLGITLISVDPETSSG